MIKTISSEDKTLECLWDEEALKFYTRPKTSSGSYSDPALLTTLASSMSLSPTSSVSSSSNSEILTTGSWDGNKWSLINDEYSLFLIIFCFRYKKLDVLDPPSPIIEFNATFAGQTSHERKTSSWLDPNIQMKYVASATGSNLSRKSSRLTEDSEKYFITERPELSVHQGTPPDRDRSLVRTSSISSISSLINIFNIS